MYFGSFSSKSDVCREFGIADFDGTILFAVYDVGSYEGSAEVIFVNNGAIWMVQGSHCSCYGLAECQWAPVEMPLDGLRRIVNKGSGLLSNYREAFTEAFSMIETLNLENASPDIVTIALKLAFG